MRSTRRTVLPLIPLLLLGLAACSGGGQDDDPRGTDDTVVVTTVTTDGTGGTSATSVADELPPPDEATFVGQARVVNLWLDGDGATQEIDVWAQRSFTDGPVLLAEGVAFGEASDYFSAPPGQSIVFTPAGEGNDAEELGSMFSPEDGQQITAMYSWEEGGAFVPNDYEHDGSGFQTVEEAPDDGQGLVILRAGQLMAHEASLLEAGLGSSFYVGDSGGTCRTQRVEDQGFTASILGGTQPVYLDLDPGPTTLTLHEWPSVDECASDPLFDLDVDVPDGEATVVYVYTPDGESLEHLPLPIA
jgi:hypothetical protein